MTILISAKVAGGKSTMAMQIAKFLKEAGIKRISVYDEPLIPEAVENMKTPERLAILVKMLNEKDQPVQIVTKQQSIAGLETYGAIETSFNLSKNNIEYQI